MPSRAWGQHASVVAHLSSFNLPKRSWKPVKQKNRRRRNKNYHKTLIFCLGFREKINRINLLLSRRDFTLRKAIVSLTIESLLNWELTLLGNGSSLAISLKSSISCLRRRRELSRHFSLCLSDWLIREVFIVVVNEDE